jgi:enolase-phosphatase E1
MARPARYVLMDIEGTTTPIAFVHEVLFPYAAKHLPAFVAAHAADAEVRRCLDETKATAQAEAGARLDDAGALGQLLVWIAEDRKHPALKTLQGLVWRQGYADGALLSQIYDDVPGALREWAARGLRLGIYSSGSVEAQVLLFRHSDKGDLTPLLGDYFDTAVGPKREPASYRTIAERLGSPAAEILFLSDVEAELDAAAQAGMAPTQIVRPGTRRGERHRSAGPFAEVVL